MWKLKTASKPEESGLQFSSRKLFNLETFQNFLSNQLVPHAYYRAHTDFNREKFVEDLNRMLLKSGYFKEIEIKPVSISDKEGEEFKLRIEFKNYDKPFVLSDGFQNNLKNNLNYVRTVSNELNGTFLEISKKFQNTQNNLQDKKSKLLNKQHQLNWMDDVLLQMHQQLRAPHRRSAETLNFILINIQSFGPKNDYFGGPKYGDLFIALMGNALISLRRSMVKKYQKQYGLQYFDVGVHRISGTNYVLSYHLNKKIPLKPQDIVKMLKNRLRRAEILLDWEWKKNKKSLNYEQQTLQEIIHMMLAPYQKEIQNGHTLPLALIDSGNIKPGPVNLMALTHYKKNQTGDILKVLKGIKMNTLFHEYNPKQKVLSAVLIQALHDEGFVFLNQNNPAQMLEVKKVPQLQAWLQSMADHMHPDALYEDQLKQRRWRAFLNGKRKKDHRLITNAKVVSPILGMSHFSEVMSYLIKILHQRFPNLEVELLDLDDLDSNAKESMRADRDGRSDLPDRIYHQYIRENKFYNLLPLYDYEGRVLVYFQIQREKLKKLGFRRLKPLIKTIWNFDALVNKYFEKYVIDPMTKLQTTANLEKELEELIKNKTEFGLGFMDFNAFGAFDTTFGSQVGDQVLRSVIKLLKTQLNPKDNLYRRGGEEFILRAPSYQRLFNLSKKIAVILEGLQDHDLFTFNLKWSELENNLRHHLQDKIESRELTSQRLNEMINAVKESFLAQIDDKQTFDPKAEYAVNVLKIKRFSKKKNQLFQSISASIGILDIWKSTKFSADHMVHKAYEYSDYAKSEVNKEGSSGEQSVIYGLDLHHAKGAQPLLKPIDWHLPTP